MLVSGAPVYLLYLLVGVCPALVVLRVVFTYVYFEHCHWMVLQMFTIIVYPFVHCITEWFRASLFTV